MECSKEAKRYGTELNKTEKRGEERGEREKREKEKRKTERREKGESRYHKLGRRLLSWKGLKYDWNGERYKYRNLNSQELDR